MPAVLMLYASVLPLEVRVIVDEQVLYAPRIVGLLLLPWIISRLLSGQLRTSPLDLLAFAGCGWMIVSFSVYYGSAAGFTRGTALAIDVLLPYLIARLAIKNLNDFRRTLVVFAPGFALVAFGMTAELVLQKPVISTGFAKVFGPLPVFEGGSEVGLRGGDYDLRFGLLRVKGPFAHPIVAGMYMGTAATLFFCSGIRGWPRIAGTLSGISAIYSVSSAAILSALLGVTTTVYDRIQRVVSYLNWRMPLMVITLFAAVASIGSDRGVFGILGPLALDPQTAFYRRLIWRYGIESVWNNPVFGIGFTPYRRANWMVASIDNYWLGLAIRFGVITSFALMALAGAALWMAARAARTAQNETDRRLFVGLASVIGILSILATTVFLFGGIVTWFYVILGIAISLTRGETALHPEVFRKRAE